MIRCSFLVLVVNSDRFQILRGYTLLLKPPVFMRSCIKTGTLCEVVQKTYMFTHNVGYLSKQNERKENEAGVSDVIYKSWQIIFVDVLFCFILRLSEVDHFQSVLAHPAFQEDPLGAITQHIRNATARGMT